MNSRNTLLLQKGNGSVVNTYDQWGIVCCKVPFKAGGKTKEPANREWNDEHGEDAFFPNKLMFEAYDAEFEMAYMGKELATNPFNLSLACVKIGSFKKWLTGNDTTGGSGSELKIYSPYAAIGRQKCYLSEISSEDARVVTRQEGNNVYNENVVTFKVKFRVCDPMTDITLSTSSSSD
jgi:hypothetical protein